MGVKSVQISELGEIVSGGTPKSSNPEYWGGDVYWATPTDITKTSNKEISDTERKITELGLQKSSAKVLPPKSLLICTRATIGEMCINSVPMSTNQGFKSIIPSDNYDVDFLYYLLSTKKNEMLKRSSGSTFLEISKKELESITLLIPPLEEQRRIAGILSTWEKAINAYDRLIQLEIKKRNGIVQEAFSNLSCESVPLGELSKCSSGGTPKSSIPEYYGSGVKWVSIADMTQQGKYISSTKKEITSLGLENSSAKLYPKGTVLFAMYASIGEVSIANCELSSSQAILGIQCGEALDNEYLYYQLLSMKNRLASMGQTGTQSNLNAGMVKAIKIPLPSVSTQKKIANALGTQDSKISLLIKKQSLLKKQKQGLMQQLLA